MQKHRDFNRSMDSSLPIGFAFRVFLLAFDRQSQVRPIFIGVWEGIAVYRGLSTTSTSFGACISIVSCALRLLFDCVFTEDRTTMTTLVFSLVLSGLISDVVGSHHGHDIQPIRQPHKRSPVTEDVPEPIRVYEVSEIGRMNRTRLISRGRNFRASPAVQFDIRTPEHEIMDFVARADYIADGHTSSPACPGPAPVPAADSPLVVSILKPMTPPCTPPKRISPPAIVEDMPTPDLGSHEDELQTPVMQTLALQGPVNVTVTDHDEPQTPLDLNLRAFPPLILDQAQPREETRSLILEDPGSDDSVPVVEGDLPEIDADNVSEPSLQSGTELSVISATNAQIITARAELLRQQAWSEQSQLPALKEKLNQAVLRKNIKDAFLCKREIETIEERVRKLHGRAARRHFRGE
ncbi:hypothetical protein B0H12DRAFT_321709 [Mycena haematopus]|nr:hypothetical protein B0H12DRAFT_321709 [Mycena haematopus]